MKILLGMSGGLDSTYAARRLMDEGHVVEGAVLVMHPHTDISAARESADALGIPLHVISAEEDFEKSVVENFLDEYICARTPNPCVICNREVKFERLVSFACENGFDKIATGHYASVVKISSGNEERYALKRSRDIKKDQTYMLWRLSQRQLGMLMLPLSDLEKSEVREAARGEGLVAADREESQEICFIPDGDYAAFIENRRGVSEKGSFINNDGKILGEHNGIIRYTIGQRKGLGIAMGERVFVTDINVMNNTITLSPDDSYADRILISDVVFSGIPEMKAGEECDLSVKVRYLAPMIKARLRYLGEGRAEALLETPVRAVTPGQSAVFYDGDLVALGGFIDSARLDK